MKTFAFLTQLLLLMLSVFLMIIVLLQRGRGGGLAGAFGGLGGQSAFGTKAGDVFTRITVGLAIAWVLVAGGSGYILRSAAESRFAQFGSGEEQMSGGEDAEGAERGSGSSPAPVDGGPGTGGGPPSTPAPDGTGDGEN